MICEEQKKKHRIGIMGGTFDPIHHGHLILAQSAYEQLHLDGILFLPNGNPPHKKTRIGGADGVDRLEMVRLAILDNPHFQLDDQEMERFGYHYTRDTLLRLTGEHPDTEYYFLIGADSLMTLEEWKDPEMICRLCVLAAAVRDEIDADRMKQKADELAGKYGARIELLHTPQIDISSSELRRLCAEGRSIRYYVPQRVEDYIRKEKLYQES